MGGIDLSTTDDSREGGLGQAGTNICSDIKHRHRSIERTLGTIRKGNNRHKHSLSSGGRYQRPHAKA